MVCGSCWWWPLEPSPEPEEIPTATFLKRPTRTHARRLKIPPTAKKGPHSSRSCQHSSLFGSFQDRKTIVFLVFVADVILISNSLLGPPILPCFWRGGIEGFSGPSRSNFSQLTSPSPAFAHLAHSTLPSPANNSAQYRR